MNFNSVTYNISLVILVVMALYTLVYRGVTGLVLCSAIGLIIAAFVDQFELFTAATVLFALLYVFYLHRYIKRYEPFQNQKDEILNRISDMAEKAKPAKVAVAPMGVYPGAIEGFQDVKADSEKDGAPSNSSSASTTLTKDQIDSNTVKSVTSALQDKSDKEIQEEEKKSASGALFKTGQMPSENMGGPKLDAGKTIMKAMETFDTNTVGAMTEDTKKLLETQKSLMGMLNQMRPVLADGKELLQTFSGMFGGEGMKLTL